VGLVASLLRVLVRIQRREGRGKGCRCASPWANVRRLGRIPQPVTLRRCSSTSCASSVVLLLRALCAQCGHERRGRSGCRSDPQRLGPVASLLRVLVRIQRREGRGKGCRCASPWVNVGRLWRIPQPVTLRRSDPPGAAAAGADPQRVGLVASLPRILERIQHGEGRGKGCRCASPWVNVRRLERIPQPVTVRRSDLPGEAAW